MRSLREALGSPRRGRGKSGARGGSRRRGLLATAVATVFAASLVAAPGAGAVVFQSAGTPFTDPVMSTGARGLAVDPESGNVYVAILFGPSGPSEVGKILRFDSAGSPLSPASMGSGHYIGVAVEQGGDHTVYGNRPDGAFGGTSGIDAFTSAGAAVGSPFPFDVDTSGAQIGSDAAGNIYFPDWETGTVKKYTSSATAGTPAEFACTGSDCESTALAQPSDVAVDASGNVYVADTENNRVVKFAPDGSYDSVFYEGASYSVAVDPASEMVLVAGNDGELGFHVTALDYSGSVVGEIPTSEFEGDFFVRVAVNPSSETLYALGTKVASDVAIYNILPGPTATTEPASAVTATTATLNGTVNPQGVLNEDCHFEYTDDVDFQANEWANAESVPCEPEPFNEETDLAVSAEVSGLSPSTTYDYRVIEKTEFATAEGDPEQFTTAAPAPVVTTEAASGISQTAATLNGKVDAEDDDASCEFEYGTTAAYGKSVPCSVNPVTGTAATAVSAALTGLAAGTTYHYRVAAENEGGLSNGSDATFTTSADTCATNAALCPPPPPPPPPTCETDPSLCRNEAAYKVCVKKANKAYRKAKAKAKTAAAKKAAKKKKAKAIRKCKAKYL
jgi:NHL repeat-containing protein